MFKYIATFILVFIFWLLLTFSLNFEEVVSGAIISLFVTALSARYLFHKKGKKVFNPKRWGYFIVYCLVFILLEIEAHLDVLYRIITGKINPAIIRAKTRIKSDAGKVLVANCITLTPGTLVVKIENDMFVHCLNYKKGKIGELLERYAKKVME